MNSRFEKYLKIINGEVSDQIQKTLDELHKSFASLTQQEQKYANFFLHDVRSGNTIIDTKKTFREYITEYQFTAKDAEIQDISALLGLDETKLRAMMNSGITEANINEYGRFSALKNTVDRAKAKAYFEKIDNKPIPTFKVSIKIHNTLQSFILNGGLEK